MAKIVGRLQQIFPAHQSESIRNAVDTVERFQGQQRDVIIASIGLGDPDIIALEDEFLFNLNRFNVLSSRCRAKLIVFATKTLLDHLSNDKNVLEQSRFLKQFAESFCYHSKPLKLGFVKDGNNILRSGTLKRK
jgi:superfamily I DNA and/or RNA helicase